MDLSQSFYVMVRADGRPQTNTKGEILVWETIAAVAQFSATVKGLNVVELGIEEIPELVRLEWWTVAELVPWAIELAKVPGGILKFIPNPRVVDGKLVWDNLSPTMS